MTLRELLANTTPGPWRISKRKGNYWPVVSQEGHLIVMPPAKDAALIALAPVLAQLALDMGDELERLCDVLGEVDIEIVEALLERLDALPGIGQ